MLPLERDCYLVAQLVITRSHPGPGTCPRSRFGLNDGVRPIEKTLSDDRPTGKSTTKPGLTVERLRELVEERALGD